MDYVGTIRVPTVYHAKRLMAKEVSKKECRSALPGALTKAALPVPVMTTALLAYNSQTSQNSAGGIEPSAKRASWKDCNEKSAPSRVATAARSSRTARLPIR